MPDVTFKVDQQVFPNGSSLGAYPVTNWKLTNQDPSGAPAGTATATGTVTAGAVTFTGLAAGGIYWVTQASGVTHNYQTLMVPGPGPVNDIWVSDTAPSNPVTGALWVDLSP